jgi:hypothetical protein
MYIYIYIYVCMHVYGGAFCEIFLASPCALADIMPTEPVLSVIDNIDLISFFQFCYVGRSGGTHRQLYIYIIYATQNITTCTAATIITLQYRTAKCQLFLSVPSKTNILMGFRKKHSLCVHFNY